MYKCKICDKKYKTEGVFTRHITQKHKLTKFEYYKTIDTDIFKLKYHKCKMCDNYCKITKIYCGNDCMHSDDELNANRARKVENDKTKMLECNICNHTIIDTLNLSGAVTTHLRDVHNIDNSDYMQYFTLKDRPLKYCPYCDYYTPDVKNRHGEFTRHLLSEHNLTIDNHVKLYPNDKVLFIVHFDKQKRIDKLNESSKNRIKCEICGENFMKLTHSHLETHGITVPEYKAKYNIISTCSETVSKLQSEITTKYNFASGSATSNKKSSLETDFEAKLNNSNIQYISQFLYDGKRYDFYIPTLNQFVEIDGTAFHLPKINDLRFMHVSNFINDFNKTEAIKNKYNLARIYWNKKMNFNNIDELTTVLSTLSYVPDYSIDYYTKIIPKEYFQKYINNKGKGKLEEYIQLLFRFITTLHPNFPYLPQKEQLNNTIKKIKDYDLTRLYSDNTFRNNSTTLGINYLKSNSTSYWKSSYKGNKSPVEAWRDKKIMKRVIKYRMGINNSNEIFDFSLHQIVRGLSAMRLTVSFFKPVLAASIYSDLLKDTLSPTVIDPSAGFGGRLLGFISTYQNGTYIGIEPNIETYKELVNLKENLTRELSLTDNQIQLYNCKFEEFNNIPVNYDLVFTSIPYFDLESYSNPVKYDNFEDWKHAFFDSLYRLKNVYINMNSDLCDLLNIRDTELYTIKNNTSHFNKTKNNKSELICKIN